MRPFAEHAEVELSAKYTGLTFEVGRSDEWLPEYDPLRLVWPQEMLKTPEGGAIDADVRRMNFDPSKVIDTYASVVRSLTVEERSILRRLRHMWLPDPLDIVRVLDQGLRTVASVEAMSGLGLLVAVTPDLRMAGNATPKFAEGTEEILGFVIGIKPPSVVGVVIHELAHVLGELRKPNSTKCHLPAYNAALKELLALVEEGNCLGHIPAVISGAGDHDFLPCDLDAEMLENGQCRVSSDQHGCLATWRAESCGDWGQCTDNSQFASQLPEYMRDFLRCATRH